MLINFWVSLTVGFVVSFLGPAFGYGKESSIFFTGYLFKIFIYRMILKLLLKNKKLYKYWLNKLYEDENLERKFIIFCIVLDLIRLASQISTIYIGVQTHAIWLGFYISSAFGFRFASISMVVHIVLLLKEIRKQEIDRNTPKIIYQRSSTRLFFWFLILIFFLFLAITSLFSHGKFNYSLWKIFVVFAIATIINALYVIDLLISKIEFDGTSFMYKTLFKKLVITKE